MARRPGGIIDQIKQVARQVLERSPQGIRHSGLVSEIQAELPTVNPLNISPTVSALPGTETDVLRPSRGFFILAKFANNEAKPALPDETTPSPEKEPQQTTIAEQDYYQPFANWLVEEEDAVNQAVVVGGNIHKDKWSTPDVIGTYTHRRNDPVPFPLELVSAEIKIDASQSVTAFGQACAYRLFSHKVYIVMPIKIKDVKDDLDRLQALCVLFGMGLVLFQLNPENPQFERRVAAQKFEPDMFYLNEFARRQLKADELTFNKLFP